MDRPKDQSFKKSCSLSSCGAQAEPYVDKDVRLKGQQCERKNCFFRRLAHVFEMYSRYFSKALKATVIQPSRLGVQTETSAGQRQLASTPDLSWSDLWGSFFLDFVFSFFHPKKKKLTLGAEAARAKSLPCLQLIIFRKNTFCQ